MCCGPVQRLGKNVLGLANQLDLDCNFTVFVMFISNTQALQVHRIQDVYFMGTWVHGKRKQDTNTILRCVPDTPEVSRA